jgi:hypothetical protein
MAGIEDITASIDALAARGNINRDRAFAAWYAISFHDLDEDAALEAAAADGGNDQGIDIAFVDDAREEIVILQAHCPQNFFKKTPKAKWDAVVASIPFIKSPNKLKRTGRPDLAETLEGFNEAYPDYRYSVGLISLGQRSPEIASSVEAHASHTGEIEYFYDGKEDIIARYKSLVEAENGVAEDVLQFSGQHFEDSGQYGRAWIGTVAAPELARLQTEYGERLFAGNVRLFLGARKGGINEQMIKTAQTHPGNFWALNNGITIVADTVAVDKTSKESKLILKRFSIVNGCQTTSSLVRGKAGPEAKVLARVIEAKGTLRGEIVRFNNSQNAVKIWAVRAADGVQEDLRRDFARAGINYAPKQAGARQRKDDKTIDLDKVTQYLASAESDFLLQAIDNKGELFDEPYQRLFKKNIKATSVYLAWLVGRLADEERRDLAAKLRQDAMAAILGVTSVYWITFVTFNVLRKFTDPTSAALTLERMTTSEFQAALRKIVQLAASVFYDLAVLAYDAETYGSFKSTLRSSKFLGKMESLINNRVASIKSSQVPNLIGAAKSAKIDEKKPANVGKKTSNTKAIKRRTTKAS